MMVTPGDWVFVGVGVCVWGWPTDMVALYVSIFWPLSYASNPRFTIWLGCVMIEDVEIVLLASASMGKVRLLDGSLIQATTVMGPPLLTTIIVSWSVAQFGEENTVRVDGFEVSIWDRSVPGVGEGVADGTKPGL